MGFFSDIGNAVGSVFSKGKDALQGVGGSLLGAGASVVSASQQASAQSDAAKAAAEAQKTATQIATEAQLKGIDLGITEQRRQFADIKKDLFPFLRIGREALPGFAPFQEAGLAAFQGQVDIAGLGDPEAEQAAIQKIAQSPRFLELMQSAENSLLQNASATGGLRGGDIQRALAEIRPRLLNQVIEEQYGRLGGIAGAGLGVIGNLATLGQSSAARTAAAGMATGANISGLLGQQGAAQAAAATEIGGAQAQLALTRGGIEAAKSRAFGQAIGGLGTSIPQNMILQQLLNRQPVAQPQPAPQANNTIFGESRFLLDDTTSSPTFAPADPSLSYPTFESDSPTVSI